MLLDRDTCYAALRTRDARFDGRFYTAVLSTGIYCRPICPARTPHTKNCVFYPSAAAAQAAGFRPCLRCRPEIAPGRAGWHGTETTVTRALGLLMEDFPEDERLGHLAARLGITDRHLRRLFDRHLGASPIAVAQTGRVLFAKQLITETRLSMTDVAFASGFRSVRRFNAVMQRVYGRPPRELRRADAPDLEPGTQAITLRLPFTPPLDWASLVAYLTPRLFPGVEHIDQDSYRRTFRIGAAAGVLDLRPSSREPALLVRIHAAQVTTFGPVVRRLRQMFDLDADLGAIEAHLAGDPALAPLVRARPGLRLPGAFDPFELAVRAVLGQQISVTAAATLARRLVEHFGDPLPTAYRGVGPVHALFPAPEVLARADLTVIGLTGTRARAISSLARLVLDDPSLLRGYAPLETSLAALRATQGLGEWTVQYIALRGLRQPDAFPTTDLGLLRAASTLEGRRLTPRDLQERAEAWRPWRAYAALHLWSAHSGGNKPT